MARKQKETKPKSYLVVRENNKTHTVEIAGRGLSEIDANEYKDRMNVCEPDYTFTVKPDGGKA